MANPKRAPFLSRGMYFHGLKAGWVPCSRKMFILHLQYHQIIPSFSSVPSSVGSPASYVNISNFVSRKQEPNVDISTLLIVV